MTYILMIWTVVAMAGDRHYQTKAMDWRPIGEFHNENNARGPGLKSAQQMCEDAGQYLGLKSDAYRCIRSK